VAAEEEGEATSRKRSKKAVEKGASADDAGRPKPKSRKNKRPNFEVDVTSQGRGATNRPQAKKHIYDVPVATVAKPVHPSRKADSKKGFVSTLKQVLPLCISVECIERLFQMHDDGELSWRNGKNIAVDLLFNVARGHDELLSSNGRVPCGSVYVELAAAVQGGWTEYEAAQEWMISNECKQAFKAQWLEEINEPQRWAMTRPIVKGAVGLCIWTILSYFPGLSFTSITHNTGQTNESLNNRGMALLPSPFCNRLFKLLEDNGFIDRNIHLPVFWDTAAVCISSNDSALSIQGSAEVESNSEPFQVVDASDCWCLQNAPPFWGLDEKVSWVKVSEDPEMWGEIGPKRKAILLNGKHELSSVVERTLIIKTSEGLVLTFPGLHGTNRCLAKQKAGSSSWQVCVNPVSGLFQDRVCMKLVKTDPPRSIQNGKCLDFGWRNFQLVDHEKFFKAGCAGAGDVDTSLKVQKTHSDHRRKVQKGLFSGADRFNMEHKQWSSADEWREAAKEMDDVSPPTRTESGPMSFLGAFMPKTAIMITPKGQKVGSGCVSTPLKLGCFIAFGGQVLLLLFLNFQTYMSHRNHTEDTIIRYHIDGCTCMHT